MKSTTIKLALLLGLFSTFAGAMEQPQASPTSLQSSSELEKEAYETFSKTIARVMERPQLSPTDNAISLQPSSVRKKTDQESLFGAIFDSGKFVSADKKVIYLDYDSWHALMREFPRDTRFNKVLVFENYLFFEPAARGVGNITLYFKKEGEMCSRAIIGRHEFNAPKVVVPEVPKIIVPENKPSLWSRLSRLSWTQKFVGFVGIGAVAGFGLQYLDSRHPKLMSAIYNRLPSVSSPKSWFTRK